jgi:hypothetical protein
VTLTEAPAAALAGASEASVGGAGFIVNGAAFVVPPGVVTVTLTLPGVAFAETENVAVI